MEHTSNVDKRLPSPTTQMGGVKGDEVLLSSQRAGAPEGGFLPKNVDHLRLDIVQRFLQESTGRRTAPTTTMGAFISNHLSLWSLYKWSDLVVRQIMTSCRLQTQSA